VASYRKNNLMSCRSDIESDYSVRHHGLVDCNREYVQQFCDRAKWPQELIDIMLDLYDAHQAPENDDTEFLDDYYR
jgi:hypothetical protein